MYNQFFTIKPRISEKKRRKQSYTRNNIQRNDNVDNVLAKKVTSEGDLLMEIPYSNITSIFKTQCNKDNEDFLKYRTLLYKGSEYFQ